MELSVCIGSACHVRGSYNVIQTFQQQIERHALHEKVELKASFCCKQCQNPGVAVVWGGKAHCVTPESAMAFFKDEVLPLAQE